MGKGSLLLRSYLTSYSSAQKKKRPGTLRDPGVFFCCRSRTRLVLQIIIFHITAYEGRVYISFS